MDKRTKGIIATIAAVVLCGCPGLMLCIFGGLAAAGTPVTTEWGGVSNTAPMDTTTAVAILCAGLIFLIIPVVIGIVTLRNKPVATDVSGPLPPAA